MPEKKQLMLEWDPAEFSAVRGGFSIKDYLDGSPLIEAWVRAVPQQDAFGRGLGTITAIGFGSSWEEALGVARERTRDEVAKRLEVANARPPGWEAPPGPRQGASIETTKSAEDLGL